MLFSSGQSLQAIDIPFNWNADYYDGTFYSEYDFKTHERNDFYLIDRKKVVRFGLFGMGMKFFFEMADGSFNLKGRRIDIEYHTDDGKIYYLTNNRNPKDLITYKQAYTSLSPNNFGVQKSYIESINFGYKTKMTIEDINLFFQSVVCLPFNSRPYIEVKMTSNKSLNGFIVFKSKGVEVERFRACLEENRAGQINWTIK